MWESCRPGDACQRKTGCQTEREAVGEVPVPVHGLEQLLLLVAGAAAVAGVARRLNWSAPLLLVVAGTATSFAPGLPDHQLDPDVVLYLILPPLLFAAAWESSYLNLRGNVRPIALLSVGLVLFSTAVVGLLAHAAIGGLPLAAAFALGAIVAPPDAVAATAIGRAVGLPRRLLVILAGESLINDATALTAYRVAVAAATGAGFSIWTGIGQFLLAAAGGAAVGGVLALAAQWLQSRVHDPLLENTVLLLTPFVAYGLAERVDVSGVLAVVVAGIYLGHQAPRRSTYATRLQGVAVWRLIEFLLESVVFALIGLQLTSVLRGLSGRSPGDLLAAGALVLALTIAARFVWIFPATYLPRWLSPRLRARDPSPPWTYPMVLSWAGMRGVVSLAAAFALTPDFPQRDLILYLTFVVVIGTLVLQGLTLPALVRRLGVTGREAAGDDLAEAAAQHAAANAALERLERLVNEDEDGQVDDEIVGRLREKAELRQLGAWERLGGGQAGPGYRETPIASYRRLRRGMLEAERSVFLELRDAGRIDDEVLRRVQHELDLEEAILARE
jgi:CPA1 family monovalent cation:H+ antiporter